MKKNEPFRELLYHSLKKIIKTMRLVLVLLTCGILHAYAADAYSQKTKLSINLTNTELVNVFDRIEQESKFSFVYNEKLLDINQRITIDANNKLINEILDEIFSGTDINYTITDRKIILIPNNLTIEKMCR